jgi:hypothetical protein
MDYEILASVNNNSLNFQLEGTLIFKKIGIWKNNIISTELEQVLQYGLNASSWLTHES